MSTLPIPPAPLTVSAETTQIHETDILVVGGGMAGVMAALAAKTEANRVLLIDPSNVLGGQGTTGGVAGFCGDTQMTNRYFAELIQQLSAYPGLIEPWRPNDDRRSYELEYCGFILQEMVTAHNIDIMLHARVVGVDTLQTNSPKSSSTDSANKGITIRDVMISTPGGLLNCRTRFVIDASGNCTVPVLAGLPVEHLGANQQLPMSLYFTLWDTGKKIEPLHFPNTPRWKSDEEIPMTSLHEFPNGKVEVKMKVVGFDAANGKSRSDAEVFARRQMYGLIYYLQTNGYRGKRLDTHALAGVSRSIGIREEKRIIGEYVLTEDDVRHSTIFDDAVAVGTYHIDFHWPDKMQRAGTGITDQLAPYHIPFRMMIPKYASNVLVPGRGASGDQMAMSSFRVMATVAQMGFAAGVAAQQFIARSIDDIRTLPLPSLQRAIENGGQSLDLSEYGAYLRGERLTHEMIFDFQDTDNDSAPFASCHASSIVELKNGCFLATWFGGEKEGDSNVSIWLSHRKNNQWSAPVQLPRACDEAHWNPVLFHSPEGNRLHLFFKTGKEPENWISWEVTSTDEGLSWSEPTPLLGSGESPESPSTQIPGHPYGPVKNKPIILKDGTWLAPNSVEIRDESKNLRLWDVRVDRSTDNGRTWHHGPIIEADHMHIKGPGVIQPTLWESTPGHVHMLIRSTCGYVCRSDSNDGGQSWSPVKITDIPAADSGLDVAQLDDGTLALVCNPCEPGANIRYPLSILTSNDNGHTWDRRFDIESEPAQEYSYPAIIPTRSGMAITYTWNRKKIAFWHGSQERCLPKGGDGE